MPPEQEPKHEMLLVTLQRLLELPTTSVRDTLHQSAQLVATALQAEKKWIRFSMIPPAKASWPMGRVKRHWGSKEQVLGLDQLSLAQGGRAVEVYQTGRP